MDVRRRMSESHLLLNQDPTYRKGKSCKEAGIIYNCFNTNTGLSESCFKYSGLKDFCKKYGLYFHMALKVVNKGLDYKGWQITSDTVSQLKRDQLALESKFYVYVYLDPRKPGNYSYGEHKFSYEPFYVGKGGQGDTITYKRWKQHVQVVKYGKINDNEGNFHKYYRIDNIIEEGLEPIIKIHQRFKTEQEVLSAEKMLIELIGRTDLKTGPLTNLCAGGFGGALSEETKKKISESLKGNVPWNRYKTISEEQKTAISLRLRSKDKVNHPREDLRPVYVPIGKKRYSKTSFRRKTPLKKTNRPAWNRGLHIILNCSRTAEQKEWIKENTPLNRPLAQYTINGNFVAAYRSQRDTARITGYKRESIKDVCNGRQLSAYGYLWKKITKEEYHKFKEQQEFKSTTITETNNWIEQQVRKDAA